MRFDAIVVGVDPSALTEVAVRSAFVLAERWKVGVVHLVHVLDGRAARDDPGRARAEAEAELADLSGPAGVVVQRHVLSGAATEALASFASRTSAELIIVATRGHGPVKRVVLGSVATSLVGEGRCPILVVAPGRSATGPFTQVLAAVDDSDLQESVLATAGSIAAVDGGAMDVVSLYDPTDRGSDGVLPRYASKEALAERRKQRTDDLTRRTAECAPDVPVRIELSTSGAPTHLILEAADRLRPDLVVVGTSGRSPLRRLFEGSTATRIVADASCPVLVVPCASVPSDSDPA